MLALPPARSAYRPAPGWWGCAYSAPKEWRSEQWVRVTRICARACDCFMRLNRFCWRETLAAPSRYIYVYMYSKYMCICINV